MHRAKCSLAPLQVALCLASANHKRSVPRLRLTACDLRVWHHEYQAVASLNAYLVPNKEIMFLDVID